MKKIFVIALGAIVLSSCAKLNEVKIVVDNKSDLKRDYEMAEVSWHLVKERLKLAEGETFIVLNNDGEQVPYQLVSYGEQDAELLIFPVTLSPKESANFKIVKGAPEKFEDQVQVTFMPQRKDDISWENDRSEERRVGKEC